MHRSTSDNTRCANEFLNGIPTSPAYYFSDSDDLNSE